MKKSDTIPEQNLDEYEASIENEALPPKKTLSARRRKEIEAAQADARPWGGPRPGAGRPGRDVRKRNISLSPEADAALQRLRKKKGMTQGAVASWAILEADKSK